MTDVECAEAVVMGLAGKNCQFWIDKRDIDGSSYFIECPGPLRRVAGHGKYVHPASVIYECQTCARLQVFSDGV